MSDRTQADADAALEAMGWSSPPALVRAIAEDAVHRTYGALAAGAVHEQEIAADAVNTVIGTDAVEALARVKEIAQADEVWAWRIGPDELSAGCELVRAGAVTVPPNTAFAHALSVLLLTAARVAEHTASAR